MISEDQRDQIASRQANAVIALFQIDNLVAESSEKGALPSADPLLWSFLETGKPPGQRDQRLRSFLIDRMISMGVSPQQLIDKLQSEQTTSAQRFALIAALCRLRPEQLPETLSARYCEVIERYGKSDPSAAIHSICLLSLIHI